MNMPEPKCPHCGSTNCFKIKQIDGSHLAAPMVWDGQKVHVPDFWEFGCECGRAFELDVLVIQ